MIAIMFPAGSRGLRRSGPPPSVSMPELPLSIPHGLAADLPEKLRALGVRAELRAGESLFLGGTEPTRVYWVESGEIVLQRLSRQGQALVLQRVREGFVAEASLQASRYHCDALAARPSVVWGFARARLLRVLEETPGLALWWAARLAGQLRAARLRCERLSLKGAEARIVHAVETEGVDGVLVLPSTRRAWAAELGLTPEALYRALARLQRDGVLALRGAELRCDTTPTPAPLRPRPPECASEPAGRSPRATPPAPPRRIR